MRSFNRKAVLTAACLGLVGPSVFAVDFPETEPNDTKATPNVRTLAPGDTISGITTGTSTTLTGLTSADYFDVTTSAAPSAGIWRYRLAITSTIAGHTGSIRGLTQAAGVINATSDGTAQSTSTLSSPIRFNQWYANQGTSRITYRVTGVAATTAAYAATLTRDPVTPVIIPDTVSAGPVTISTLGLTTVDSDVWLYDANFNAIANFGNDDAPTPDTSLQSSLTRNLAPGVYTLAISTSGMRNNLASPTEDRWRSDGVLDFPNALTSSNVSAAATDLDFSITHGGGTIPVTASRAEFYGVLFYQFTVAVTFNPVLTACTGTPSASVSQGASVTLSTNVAWTGAPGTVTADLSAFGGSNVAPLTNNGGGNYSIVLNVPGAQPTGPSPVIISGTNAAGTGTCSIPVTVTLPPLANDSCATAITIPNTTFPVAVSGDNTLALSSDDRTSTCSSVINSVWYDFTAPAAGGSFQFDTEGSTQLDMLVTVFGTCVGPEIDCDDESGSGSQALLALTLAPNQNVKIMVSTWFLDDPGAYVLNVSETTPPPPPPANDLCANATVINNASLPVTLTTDNTTATNLGDASPSCEPNSVRGIWFDFTAPAAGIYTFDTNGSVVTDTIVVALVSCGGAALGCDDDTGTAPPNSALLSLAMTAGQNIRLQVSVNSLLFIPTGLVSLTVSPPPCVTFNTQPVLSQQSCVGQSASFTVAVTTTGIPTFQWETAATIAGPFTALTNGSNPGIGNVSGATTATLTINGIELAANTTVFRVVATGVCGGNNSNNSANSTLFVLDCPVNDECAAALPAILGTTTGDNTGATSTNDPVPTCQTLEDKGMWYTFTADADGGLYLIDTENSSQPDTVLTVYASCGGAQLACDDDSGVTPGFSSRLTVDLTANQSVRIMVSSFGTAPLGGGFNLNISECTNFTTQPADLNVAIGATANFSAVAVGPGTLTFQWQRQLLGVGAFTNLTDGVVAGLGTVSGATTADLSIALAESAASTDKFRVVVTGTCAATNSAAATLTVGDPFPARCNGADIAYDNGDFLPRAEIVDGTNGTPAIPGPFGGVNNGVTEADYNVFFANFFDANAVADIANDDGTSRVPTPAPGTVVNNGVTEGDYNYFFSVFFDGCSL